MKTNPPARSQPPHIGYAARLRLTLAISGVLVLLLAAFSIAVYALLRIVVLQDIAPFREDDPVILLGAQRQLELYAWQLVLVNIGALVVVLAASFFIAKASLRPLEQAIDLQRQFTNDASHDLRTPLAVIRMEASVLTGDQAPHDAAERLRIIDEQAQRMERLIEQLLVLSHVDADSALNREPTDLSHVVNGVVRDLRPLAQARSIDLKVSRGESALVLGDELKLSQMVANLVDNAIKYSPEAAPVSVSVWQNRDNAYVAVTDAGDGIPASEFNQIFQRFHRADVVKRNGRGGHGLGLPLCRWIARAHGGDVTVSSRVGEGSIFTVRLPALAH
jgi:signal transduction histidine kinase